MVAAAPIYRFPPHSYPVKVELFRSDTGEKVWEKEIPPPGENLQTLEIPGLVAKYGCRITARVTFSDGHVRTEL